MRNGMAMLGGLLLGALLVMLVGCATDNTFAGQYWYQPETCPNGAVSVHCQMLTRGGPQPWMGAAVSK